VQLLVIHRTLPTRFFVARYSSASLINGIDRTRALRGAICGAVAAGVWAGEQPVDKALLGSRFDDLELLGRLATRDDDDWLAPGLLLHLQNGAVFGALYSLVGPSLPVPPILRGPAAALTEHLLSWPLVLVVDRFHPARRHLPRLWGNRRAFTQATIRHLLFGLVLGELERRVNPPEETPPPESEAVYSSNGHGSLENALSVET
jgi:hypothetical protein